jgi:chemotaxis protein CheX
MTSAPSRPVVDKMVGHLVDVTREVFETMVNWPVEVQSPNYPEAQPPANVVSTVAFSGSLNGYVSVCVSQLAAGEIACALLLCEPEEAASQIQDAAGEMANMITGSVRSLMADGGETLGISTPIVTIGNDFATAAPRGALQVSLPFKKDQHTMYVHLVIQGDTKR